MTRMTRIGDCFVRGSPLTNDPMGSSGNDLSSASSASSAVPLPSAFALSDDLLTGPATDGPMEFPACCGSNSCLPRRRFIRRSTAIDHG